MPASPELHVVLLTPALADAVGALQVTPEQRAYVGDPAVNVVNTLRLLGRWMRMLTIPNQSSVAMAYKEFDEAGRMKPSSYYDRIVDVMEELVRFTVLMRPHAVQLVDRYSERKQLGVPVDDTTDHSAIAISGR